MRPDIYSFEARLNTIATQAFETWTNNGLAIPEDLHADAFKSCRDVANNVYFEGIDEVVWLKTTVERLNSSYQLLI